MITATLKTYRQTPRKVRLVADLIKGKSVEQAIAHLNFLPKRASLPLRKLIDSAVANAQHNFGAEKSELMVKDVRVDKGVVMRRFMPRARVSASPIKKRTSHIVLVLGKKEPKKTSKASEAKKLTKPVKLK